MSQHLLVYKVTMNWKRSSSCIVEYKKIVQSCAQSLNFENHSIFAAYHGASNASPQNITKIHLEHYLRLSHETPSSTICSQDRTYLVESLTLSSPSTMANNPMDAISAGCLRRVFAGETVTDPIVQCVQIKPMQQGANGAERFRVVFNDTVNFIQSMIAQRELTALAATS